MNSRFSAFAVALMMSAAAAAQAPGAVKKAWRAPRTAAGQPDLQGIYTTATLTPLERPADLAGKQFFTEKEAVEYENTFLKQTNRDRRDGPADADVGRAYNEFWFSRGDHIVSTRRTALIVDPPDGKIPALTPAAQKRQAERAALNREHAFDAPEYRGLAERCLLWGTAGPPMLPGGYNNNYQIVQTPDYVMILVEMIHDVRVIPLDGRPHMPSHIREWLGDSRGHWEGNTLVVDTTNFTNKTNFRGGDENMHLVERFTRTAPDTVMYQFTVEDPTAFTKPWSAEIPMNRIDGPIIEYACNEGNYGMAGILSGGRAQEKK